LSNELSCKSVEDVNNVTIKFDTACSRNMSGVPGRITGITDGGGSIGVRGFNGSFSLVDGVGHLESRIDSFCSYLFTEQSKFFPSRFCKEIDFPAVG
jgi:sigma54-dependent transcription regulator